MSLRLLLDEDTQARQLIFLLRNAGHDVQTVSEANPTDQGDSSVLAYARQTGRLLLTRNCGDFQALHRSAPPHPGIIGVFQYNNPEKDMSYADIVQAVANLVTSGWTFAGEFVVLNQWHFPSTTRTD